MRKMMIVFGISLGLVMGFALGGCDVGDPIALREAGRDDDDCEKKPTCETLGFGSHPEYYSGLQMN